MTSATVHSIARNKRCIVRRLGEFSTRGIRVSNHLSPGDSGNRRHHSSKRNRSRNGLASPQPQAHSHLHCSFALSSTSFYIYSKSRSSHQHLLTSSFQPTPNRNQNLIAFALASIHILLPYQLHRSTIPRAGVLLIIPFYQHPTSPSTFRKMPAFNATLHAIDTTLLAINGTANLANTQSQCPTQHGLSYGDIAAIVLGCLLFFSSSINVAAFLLCRSMLAL